MATKRKLSAKKADKATVRGRGPQTTSDKYNGRIVKDKKVRGLAGREPNVRAGKPVR